MKNIHILPTENPSRLWINNLLQGKLELSKEFLIGSNTAQHIYITSDEEIKEGDWVCNVVNNNIYNADKAKLIMVKENLRKIILTTDQDLIADGVQAIDDEFLEWFVKNPSCEYVGVVDNLKYFNIDELRERHLKGLPYLYSQNIGYKIIIPQEETKQDQVERMYSEVDMIDYALYIHETKKNLLSPSEWWFEQFKKK